MKEFNIERLVQPNAKAYELWHNGEVVVKRHFPRGTMPQSPGEGYGFEVTCAGFADAMATTLAGFLQDNPRENDPPYDYGVGIVRHNGVYIPNMHIFRCPKGADPIHSGITDAYILEGTAKDIKQFMAQAHSGKVELLLHEGAHPHRGDLPHFVHWLESVKAIPAFK